MNRTLVTTALLAAAFGASSAAAQSRETPTSEQARSTAVASDQESGTLDKHKRAGEIMRQMLPPQSVAAMESNAPNTHFGGEFARLAYENAYVALWARPGLTPKERSILTIGILIGLGNERELRSHFAAGLKNGLTPRQLEEMIYHATAYAGFPAAASALAVATKVVEEQGK